MQLSLVNHHFVLKIPVGNRPLIWYSLYKCCKWFKCLSFIYIYIWVIIYVSTSGSSSKSVRKIHWFNKAIHQNIYVQSISSFVWWLDMKWILLCIIGDNILLVHLLVHSVLVTSSSHLGEGGSLWLVRSLSWDDDIIRWLLHQTLSILFEPLHLNIPKGKL